ncbi:MAG: hypothetical protein Q9226_008327 [Calogaya cf. arnoldii]
MNQSKQSDDSEPDSPASPTNTEPSNSYLPETSSVGTSTSRNGEPASSNRDSDGFNPYGETIGYKILKGEKCRPRYPTLDFDMKIALPKNAGPDWRKSSSPPQDPETEIPERPLREFNDNVDRILEKTEQWSKELARLWLEVSCPPPVVNGEFEEIQVQQWRRSETS